MSGTGYAKPYVIISKPTHLLCRCLLLNIDILLANLIKPEQSEIFHFDLTSDVINDLQVKLYTVFGTVTCGAVNPRPAGGPKGPPVVFRK